MRFIGRCYQAQGDLENATNWFIRATIEAPNDREPWVELGKSYYNLALASGTHKNWSECLKSIERALEIKDRPLSYICEPFAWNHEPYDYACVAAWNTNQQELAKKYAGLALQNISKDHQDYDRIFKNHATMKAKK